MKKLMICMVAALAIATAGFAQQPTPATEHAIADYLKALKSNNSEVRLEALKHLNDLKAEYPNVKMKEFDNFLSSQIMEKSSKNIISSLASTNSGVRHSTLHVLVRLKSDYPELDMKLFNNALEKMSNQDPFKHLQVDAKLAYIYLNDTELVKNIKITEKEAIGDCFNQIHLAMESDFSNKNPEND